MPILRRMAGPLLLGCQNIAKAYGTRSLFSGVSFGIFERDRACVVGPNGSGKSTLLKILAGLETPDCGTRSAHGRLRVGYGAQDPVFPEGATVEETLLDALGHLEADDRPGRVARALGRAGFTDAHAD